MNELDDENVRAMMKRECINDDDDKLNACNGNEVEDDDEEGEDFERKSRNSNNENLVLNEELMMKHSPVFNAFDSKTSPTAFQNWAGPNRVLVCVRVRPSLQGEKTRYSSGFQQSVQVDTKGKSVTVNLPPEGRGRPKTPDKTKQKVFSFDTVFSRSSSQEVVFNGVGAPLVDAVLKGINGCLIAYGQTGAGKTYTTFGPSCFYSDNEDEISKLGLIPRAVHALFERLNRKVNQNRGVSGGSRSRYSYSIHVSYYQIYLDSYIQDLINPNNTELQIRRVDDKLHKVEGLSTHRVTSVGDVLALLEQGGRNKIVAHTGMNASSSRSHSIFTVQVSQHVVSEEGEYASGNTSHTLKAVLTCVDLAGSERASRTQPEGIQLEEAKSINRSLSALGNVIAALGGEGSSGNDSEFVPWRDSKLTRVLQDCLSGDARVSLVINVGPGVDNVKESVNSLLFGRRSMCVNVNPVVNLRIENEHLAQHLQDALDQASSRYQLRVNELQNMLLRKTNELEKWKKNSHLDMECENRVAELLARVQQLEDAAVIHKQHYDKIQDSHSVLEDALLEQMNLSDSLKTQLGEERNKYAQVGMMRDAEIARLWQERHEQALKLADTEQRLLELQVSKEMQEEERITSLERQLMKENGLSSANKRGQQEAVAINKEQTESLIKQLQVSEQELEASKLAQSELQNQLERQLEASKVAETDLQNQLDRLLEASKLAEMDLQNQLDRQLEASKRVETDLRNQLDRQLETSKLAEADLQSQLDRQLKTSVALDAENCGLKTRLEMLEQANAHLQDATSLRDSEIQDATEKIARLEDTNQRQAELIKEMANRLDSAETRFAELDRHIVQERQLYETLLDLDRSGQMGLGDQDAEQELLQSPRFKNALTKSRQALERAMDAINSV